MYSLELSRATKNAYRARKRAHAVAERKGKKSLPALSWGMARQYGKAFIAGRSTPTRGAHGDAFEERPSTYERISHHTSRARVRRVAAKGMGRER